MKESQVARDIIKVKRNKSIIFPYVRFSKNIRKIIKKEYANTVVVSFIRRDNVKSLHGGTLCGVLKKNDDQWVVLLNENAAPSDIDSAVETLANMEETAINEYKKDEKHVIPLVAF